MKGGQGGTVSKKKRKEIPLPVLPADLLLVDTHCHLEMEQYEEDRDVVIARAVQAGVKHLITIGIDLPSSRQAIALAEQYECISATVGVHPHNVASLSEEDYLELARLAGHEKVVAYGEIGIDQVRGMAPLALQEQHFRKQLELAMELGLPPVIHDREAHDIILDALQEAAPFKSGGVMHCFSGDATFARKILELGFYISIPGVVTFNKAEQLQDAVREIPLEFLLLETDAPFLAPVPRRGKRNEPSYTLYTAQKVADLKGISLEQVARQTTANARTVFQF